MAWDGNERRKHSVDDCGQESRIQKMELAIDGTIKQLVEINLTLMKIQTMLEGKVSTYDKHVVDGEDWRKSITMWLSGAILTGFASAVSIGIWVGMLSNQIHVNTGRLDIIEQQHRHGVYDPQKPQTNP